MIAKNTGYFNFLVKTFVETRKNATTGCQKFYERLLAILGGIWYDRYNGKNNNTFGKWCVTI